MNKWFVAVVVPEATTVPTLYGSCVWVILRTSVWCATHAHRFFPTSRFLWPLEICGEKQLKCRHIKGSRLASRPVVLMGGKELQKVSFRWVTTEKAKCKPLSRSKLNEHRWGNCINGYKFEQQSRQRNAKSATFCKELTFLFVALDCSVSATGRNATMSQHAAAHEKNAICFGDVPWKLVHAVSEQRVP